MSTNYTPQTWADGDATKPLSAARMTHLEDGIAAVDTAAIAAVATAQATAIAASQPIDSDLTAIAALTTTAYGRSLLTQANAAAAQSILALGSAATQATSAFDAAGAAAAAQAAAISAAATDATTKANAAAAASQPLDSDLTAIAALTTTTFGRSFLALVDAPAARTLLGLGTAATQATTAFDAAGAASTAQAAAQTYADGKLLKGNVVTKTANYTAVLGDVILADTTSATFTVTIPAASSGKGRIVVKWVAGTVAPTIALTGTDHVNTSTGVQTFTPTLLNQGYQLESDGAALWVVTADDLSLTGLDARYVQAANAAPLAQAGQTPSQTPVAPGTAAVGSLAVTARADHVHPSVGVFAPYGNGADGSITLDGSATVGKFTKVTSTQYRLSVDVYAANLTIAAGITIETAGFKVHVNGTLTGPASGTAATFQCSPPALTGTNQQTTPTGGTSLVGGGNRYATLGYGQIGRAGGTGVGTANGGPSSNTTLYAGLAGNLTAAAGAGGSGTSGAGGAGLPYPNGMPAPNANNPLTAFEATVRSLDAAAAAGTPITFGPLMGGFSGGSGAGDGTNSGGAGGQGGNVVIVNARIVTGKVNVNAAGQAGGTPTVGNCGGGGGGTGGAAILNSTDLTGWTGTVTAAAGAGGAGVGTGTAGTAGTAGLAAATQWA